MFSVIADFTRNESGATAIEYGLIATMLCLIIIASLMTIGSELAITFATIAGGFVPAGH